MARSERNPGLRCHRLNVHESPDAVPSLASTESGVLHPTHRRINAAERRSKALIDIHSAAFDLARDAAATLMIRSPDAGVESVVRFVGASHGLIVVNDRIDADNRAEGFLGVAFHLRRYAPQDSRLVEQLTEIFSSPPPGQHGCPLSLRVLDMRADLLQPVMVDQAADVMLEIRCVAEPERLGPLDEGTGKRLEKWLCDVDALSRNTHLSGTGEGCPN